MVPKIWNSEKNTFKLSQKNTDNSIFENKTSPRQNIAVQKTLSEQIVNNSNTGIVFSEKHSVNATELNHFPMVSSSNNVSGRNLENVNAFSTMKDRNFTKNISKNVQKKSEVFDSNKKPSFADVVRRNLTNSRSHDASESNLQKGSTNKISLDRNLATFENDRPFSSKLSGNPGGVLGQVLASAATGAADRGMLRHKIA